MAIARVEFHMSYLITNHSVHDTATYEEVLTRKHAFYTTPWIYIFLQEVYKHMVNDIPVFMGSG